MSLFLFTSTRVVWYSIPSSSTTCSVPIRYLNELIPLVSVISLDWSGLFNVNLSPKCALRSILGIGKTGGLLIVVMGGSS